VKEVEFESMLDKFGHDRLRVRLKTTATLFILLKSTYNFGKTNSYVAAVFSNA